MKPLFPSLICAATLSWYGAAGAYSQTALEILDRAQKDLQTQRNVSKEKAGAEKAKPSSEESGFTRGVMSEEYGFRTVESSLQQVRQYLISGNEENAIQMLAQIQASGGFPDDVKATLAAVAERLTLERTEKETAFANDVEAARKRAGEAVLKAKEPKDLDATLTELTNLAEKNPMNRYNGGNGNRTAKLQAAVSFVNRWQDYLLALHRNNDNNLSNALRNLADSGSEQPPLIPRSEILSRMPQTDNENNSSGRPSRSERPLAQIDADASVIVQGIKTFDDLPAAFTKLVALRREITSRSSYSLGGDSLLGTALTGLQGLQRTYLELRNGLATTVDLSDNRVGVSSFPEVENTLLVLRLELLRTALPRLLGVTENEKPKEGEALDVFLRRSIEGAKGRQDWAAVVRGLELKRKLASVSTSSFGIISSEQETSAFKSFFAARNLEAAGQYDQAVTSYLEALRSGQQDLPAAVIGERLTAIQQAHPTEYAAGKERSLNPPPSPYQSGPFGGMGGMYRGNFDPRFPGGRPPSARTPADDNLAVPAASPAPPKPTIPAAGSAPEASPASATPVPAVSPKPTS